MKDRCGKDSYSLAGYLVSASLLLAAAVPAGSAQGNVYFGGDITTNSWCSVVVQQAGTLAANPESTILGSKQPGGQPGIARVTSILPYDVSVNPWPNFTSAPSGGNDNVTFETTFSGQNVNRGSTFPERPGNQPVRMNWFSTTDITVHLTATKPDGFPAGSYATQAVVRCE